MNSGKKKDCNSVKNNKKLCIKKEFKTNCPVTCNLCRGQPSWSPSDIPSITPSFSPSGEPTAIPSTSPSGEPTSVPTDSDSDKPSDVPSDIPTKKASLSPSEEPSSDIGKPSAKPSLFPTNLPSVSPTICEDTIDSFLMSSGKKKDCHAVKNNKNMCTKKEFQINCPVACDLCRGQPSWSPSYTPSYIPSDTPTITPSSSPSDIPSTIPSHMPSVTPSVAPSDLPSFIPTTLPSNSPTICADVEGKFVMSSGKKKDCNAANINKHMCSKNEFKKYCPVTCDMCRGQPSSSPSYSFLPSNAPSFNPTDYKCHLTGTLAFSSQLNFHPDYLVVIEEETDEICSPNSPKSDWGCVHEDKNNNEETVTINDVGGKSYIFVVQHDFYEIEKYNGDPDISAFGELLVNANYKDQSNSLGLYKHERIIYPEVSSYKGTFFVDVACDHDCTCTAEKVNPVCPIYAELRFPKLEMDPVWGFGNDYVTVENDEELGSCSRGNPMNKWCIHESYADSYNAENDDKDDHPELESLLITEAANAKFKFTVQYDYSTYESFYDQSNHEITGALTIWINGKNEGTYEHRSDLVKESRGAFYVDVDCDELCNCSVLRSDPACNIQAHVNFPTLDEAPYYGYHNDDVVVQKVGETEKCKWGTNETDWGCSHDKHDAFIARWKRNPQYNAIDSESVTVKNGLNGDFRFILRHVFSNLERLSYYTEDYKLESTMTILINGDERGTYKHLRNKNVDTHLENGDVNKEYGGITYVDIQCDSLCNCELEQSFPINK